MIEEDEVYGQADEVLLEYQNEIGSHSYMPKNFLGISTKDLGFHISGKDSSFLTLKDKLAAEAKTLKPEDRMQGVRYLCSIPFNNAVYYCIEAAMDIIRDETIDIYTRYYFLSNNEKYFRLDDHVVHFCHPAFFNWGIRAGPFKAPYDIMIVSAKFILTKYGADSTIRQKVLDWCLDIIDSAVEDFGSKLKTIRLLKEFGHNDEQQFADSALEALPIAEVGEDYVKAQNILRTLRTTHVFPEDGLDETPEEFQMSLASYVDQILERDTETLDVFFEEYVYGSALFEGISITQICVLIYKQMFRICAEDISQVQDSILDIIYGEEGFADASDLIVKLLLVLESYVTPRPFELLPSVEDRIRNEVFAGLNNTFMTLGEGMRKVVEKSRDSEDKSAAMEFLIYFEDDKQTMLRDYTSGGAGSISKETFLGLYDKAVKEWLN